MNINQLFTSISNSLNNVFFNRPVLLDPLDEKSPLPLALVFEIFKNLKTEITTLALVSKNWKSVVDNNDFRLLIRPPETFGSQEWNEYMGVDAGEEPPMPRWTYGFMENGDYMMTFVPKVVKVTNCYGTIIQIALNCLNTIGELTTNPKKGNAIRFQSYPRDYTINLHTWKSEEPHWVWIGKSVMGRCKDYTEQQAIAKEKKVQISDLIDTVISVFMEYIRNGKHHFMWNEPHQSDIVRMNELHPNKKIRLALAVMTSGLKVHYTASDGDVPGSNLVFVPSRKSFKNKNEQVKCLSNKPVNVSINGQTLLDPHDKTNPLPLDCLFEIFKNLKTEIPDLALVCKNWKSFVDNKTFRNLIRPPEAFGSQEWKEYVGVDAGEEPPLPRWAYGFMQNSNYILTFVPKIVEVTNTDGTITKTPLDCLKTLSELTTKPKIGNKIGYSDPKWPSWNVAIEEKRKLEESHWVWIGKEMMGLHLNYNHQLEIAKKNQVQVSDLIDTCVSVSMAYIRSGERHLICDFKLTGLKGILARVNDKTNDKRLGVGLMKDDLLVPNFVLDNSGSGIGFVPSRKSF